MESRKPQSLDQHHGIHSTILWWPARDHYATRNPAGCLCRWRGCYGNRSDSSIRSSATKSSAIHGIKLDEQQWSPDSSAKIWVHCADTQIKIWYPTNVRWGTCHPVNFSIRYLGVELRTRLSFTTHIATASRKVTESARAFGCLMPNIGGPEQSKRALLESVTNRNLLYASPTWSEISNKTAKNHKAMTRTQRTMALLTTRAYRIVSAEASSVLSSMLPADLLAHEQVRVKSRQTEKGETTKTTATIKLQEKKSSSTLGKPGGTSQQTADGCTGSCQTWPGGYPSQHLTCLSTLPM